jgi:hypothetical protein
MTITLIIIGLVIVAVLYFLVRLADRKNKPQATEKVPPLYKYTRKDHIMTAPEDIFFKMLQETAGDRYFVFPQVHLSAILDYKVPGQNWKPAFRHINGKSVDFVLCDKTSLKPMYAVELDDIANKFYEAKTDGIQAV